MKNIIPFAATLLLVACQQSHVTESQAVIDKPESTITETTVQAKKMASEMENSIEQVTMHAANTGPASLRFTHRTRSERAQVGVPFDIDIDFINMSDESFTTEFAVTPGLRLSSPNRSLVESSKQAKPATQKITVVPQAEGIYYLNIYKLGAEQKPSAIKIVVGNKDIREYMQTVGELKDQADGTQVVSMKAEESE